MNQTAASSNCQRDIALDEFADWLKQRAPQVHY